MEEKLSQQLLEFLSANHPDLLYKLQEERGVADYMSEKISSVGVLLQREGIPYYIMEAECIEVLNSDLKFSKYNYILAILEEEFALEYAGFYALGVLQTEVINMIDYCFGDIELTEENEDDNFLRYTVIGGISEYLESKRENEIVSNELQSTREVSR